MAIKIVNVKEISREEWLSYRRTGIGGSDSAVVLNLNPYRSRLELYADKIGMLPDKEDNEAMRIGRDLEQYVADRFCEATGKKVRRNNFMWRSESNPFMIADIDREIIGENAGLECKTTSVWNKSDFSKGDIPLTYYVQCMHYMAVMGYERMYLAVLILGKGFYWFTIGRNEDEIKALVEAEKAFMELVEKRQEPDADGSDSAELAVGVLTGQADTSKPTVNLFGVENSLKEIERLSAEKSQIDKELESHKQAVKLFMNDATTGATDKYKVSWSPSFRTTVDSKKLSQCYPEVYKICSKQTESRTFRFTVVKEKTANDNI